MQIANLSLMMMASAVVAGECPELTLLTEFIPGQTYQGFEGGLYPGESNECPPEHAARLRQRAVALGGSAVLMLSIGPSNLSQECWAATWDRPQPYPWTFGGQLAEHSEVGLLTFLNGAKSGQTAEDWIGPENYDRVRDFVLEPRGFTEDDVRIGIVKWATHQPGTQGEPSLPDPGADAFDALAYAGDAMRTMKTRYPNLDIAIMLARITSIHSGPDSVRPEPFPHEIGFAIKWLIGAQIRQLATGEVDPIAGDLSQDAAPLMVWGPYLWDCTWSPDLFQADGIHPNAAGEQLVADALIAYVLDSPFCRPWSRQTPRLADIDDDGLVGFRDQLVLLSAWGSGRYAPECDLDGDGAVGFNDQIILLADWD